MSLRDNGAPRPFAWAGLRAGLWPSDTPQHAIKELPASPSGTRETLPTPDAATLRRGVWRPRIGGPAGRGIIGRVGKYRRGRSAHAEAAAFSGAGQARDFPFHERRT